MSNMPTANLTPDSAINPATPDFACIYDNITPSNVPDIGTLPNSDLFSVDKRVSAMAKHITRRDTTSSRRKPYADNEIERMWQALILRGTPALRLAVALALYDGLRLSEIVNLRFEHLDVVHSSITLLRGKNRRVRAVRLNKSTEPYLELVLKHRSHAGGSAQLLNNRRGSPYTAQSLRKAALSILAMTDRGQIINPEGIDNWSFHRLRVTCLTKFFIDKHASVN